MSSCSTVSDLTFAVRTRGGAERMVKSTVLASCPQCRPEAVEKSAASGTNCRSVAVFQNHESYHFTKA